VFSEVHPSNACMAAATCRLQGRGVDLSVAAKVDMPFGALLKTDTPEPLECFHTCQLPPGSEGRRHFFPKSVSGVVTKALQKLCMRCCLICKAVPHLPPV
jgi:hypothetical protein